MLALMPEIWWLYNKDGKRERLKDSPIWTGSYLLYIIIYDIIHIIFMRKIL